MLCRFAILGYDVDDRSKKITMTKDEKITIINKVGVLLENAANNIETIQTLLNGVSIDRNFGEALVYSNMTARGFRVLLFLIMLNESSNLKTDWVTAYHLLKEAYLMTDNIYAQLQKSPYPFDLSDYLLEMKQHINTEELMHPEELEYLNGLQFPLTAYRGMCNKEYEDGRFGVSWTDIKEVAEKYVYYSKNNNTDQEGKIVSFKIDRSDIFAAWGVVGKDKELIIPGLKKPEGYGR